jgi:hypothetical protein
MSKSFRLGVVALSLVLVNVYVESPSAYGQTFKSNSSSQKNRDNDDNDDDDDENQNNDNNNNNNQRANGSNNSSRSQRSNQERFEQFQEMIQRQRNRQNDENDNQGGQGQNNTGQKGRRQGQFGPQFPFQQGQNEFRRDHDDDDQRTTLRLGNWQGNRWQGPRKIDNWVQAYGSVSGKPFSSQWYQDHPKAWKFDKGEANIWVTASVPGLYKWLGWGNAPPQYSVGYSNQVHDFSHFGQWYPLGVYSLMAGPGDMGTRIVQLAVDRHGHLAGNYYDLISDSNYSVSGDIRQSSQRAYFALNKNKYLRFRANIYELLQPYGSITVQLPGGDQRWQFVRLEN